ncbi:MAG: hypothetical protein LUG23_09510 [Oscillospiraceae bacterium]|nr:hypothetical protein [Oscillospiraceae bacterium]
MKNKKPLTKVYVSFPNGIDWKNKGEANPKFNSTFELACLTGIKLIKFGYLPLIPQIYFSSMVAVSNRLRREDYEMLSHEWLTQSDEMWVFGGILTDEILRDVEIANMNNIPVRYMMYTESNEFLEIPVCNISKWKVIGE